MKIEDTVLALVDVQGKLAEAMYDRENLYDALQRLVKGCMVLGVPVVWMEQIPEKMGETIPLLREILKNRTPIAKSAFSCCGEQGFVRAIHEHGRRCVVIAGIETHVCVYQTARDLAGMGYTVQVVADATSSRTAQNRELGLERIKACGAELASVEMLLFDLLQTAEHPAFRDILRIVK